MLLEIKRLECEMSVVRTQGSCVAIRTLSPSSSINRCGHGSSVVVPDLSQPAVTVEIRSVEVNHCPSTLSGPTS
ncbi:hypothetical protein Pint_23714 [Pistacia integerrima]|uniref:Uncharacterized protein n=1 Tax=Pistacia integerrima TaxID=434235 RepID=A0ACC0YNA0_9ROSI|nr:hypothetical protein Pint_23714 [Pistacia integerrima]